METIFKKQILVLFILFIKIAVFSQTADEIRQKFPGNDIVMKNYEMEMSFYLKDNIPVAEKKYNTDMVILSEKNAAFNSRYSIYHSSYSELLQMNAYSSIPNGSRYKDIKVADTKVVSSTSSSTFYDDSKETIFDFPGLTKNAFTHVDYTLFCKDAHLISAFYLPVFTPVLAAKYTVHVPYGISINYIIKNDPEHLFNFTETKKKKETIYTWTANNVKEIEYFSNAPDVRYFQPHIIVYITSYETEKGKQSFLNNLQDLYDWNFSFINNLNKENDPSLKYIVDSLTEGKITEKEKAVAIYYWVQNHIRYVAFEDGLEGFRPRQAAEVCRKRYGDCKDMSSIITQMLRMAGIKSFYTWIGTRELPYTYTETPLPLVDNHMICAANIDNKWYFLDGTDPNAKFDMPPEGLQGKEALISIDEKEYKLLTVPVSRPENNIITDSTFLSLTTDGVKGFESVNYKGYFGKEVYNSLMYNNEEGIKEYVNKRMSKGSNKFLLGKYEITKVNKGDNIATISAEFNIPGYSKKIGDEYYINLNVEKILENQVIDIEKRKLPIENGFNYSIKQYHILDIPEGYLVSFIPNNYNFENDLIKINMYYKVDNEKIIAAQEVITKKLLLHPSDFEEWNKPMKVLQPYYKESIVLKKK